jgi:alpha-tubulin suppressor-like RCC1 family protein
MTGRPVARAVVALALAASACEKPRTEILLIVDTELRIPDELDQITIQIHTREMRDRFKQDYFLGPGKTEIPMSLGLVPDNDPRIGFQVEVTGYRHNVFVIERSASTTLVPEQTLVLRIDLVRVCKEVVCDVMNTTCHDDGKCRPDDVPASSLPRVGEVRDGATTVDAARADAAPPDTAMPDAAPPDAPTPTPDGSTAPPDAPDGGNATGPEAGACVTTHLARGVGNHGCAVRDDGSLLCWGDNFAGQLGDGTTTPRASPVLVAVGGGAAVTTQVATGTAHTCARRSDGSLWCWGDNSAGQLGDGSTLSRATPMPVAALGNSVLEVAAGDDHTCARRDDGTVSCWGDNQRGQVGDSSATRRLAPVAITALGTTVRELSAGHVHTCARRGDGSLWCWGENGAGQLGDGTTMRRPAPVPVTTLGTTVAAVAAGGFHTCARRNDGSVWCWGNNDQGALGDGSTMTRLEPVPVPGIGTRATQLSAGEGHTCARRDDATLWCWGDNQFGQVGDGTMANRTAPAAVTALGATVAEVAARLWHTCARRSDGAVTCWGYNAAGELGDGSGRGRSAPQQVPSLMAMVAQAAGGGLFGCARRNDGSLWCWGSNSHGQLATTTPGAQPHPAPLPALGTMVAEVATGDYHTCARRTDGSLWCWGRNQFGQVGDGTALPRPAPVRIGAEPAPGALGTDVAEVAAGQMHSCARRGEGTLWCWGRNSDGQLGDGSMMDRPAPVQVTALGATVVEVALGQVHTCARRNDGTLWCWGGNVSGQLGDGSSTGSPMPLQVTALGTNVAEVSAGALHTCARRSDGSLWCWGNNGNGQVGDGSNVGRLSPVPVTTLGTTVAEVSASFRWHTCARDTGGGVWCWGANRYGQLGDGTYAARTTPVRVVGLGGTASAITTGQFHSCARRGDATLWCWGDNAFGQLGDGTATRRPTPGPALRCE